MNQDSRSAQIGTEEFFQGTLDSLLSHVAILDEDGSIIAVNAAWRRYARCNGGDEGFCGLGVNYLHACDAASGDQASEASEVAIGIRDVVAGRRDAFYLEYPCHSPVERQWYSLRATRFEVAGEVRAVVAHDDITPRKLAEIRLKDLNVQLQLQATTDDLTGLPNRRSFDQTLEREIARHRRGGSPLTLAMLDVDCFKQLNDVLGHLAGDDCLRALARAIGSRLRLPVDLVARYGGEEFALILPKTGAEEAAEILRGVLRAIRELAIPNPGSSVPLGVVTASVGSATAERGGEAAGLLDRADRALYRAKQEGRDRLVAWEASGLPGGPGVPLVLRRAPAEVGRFEEERVVGPAGEQGLAGQPEQGQRARPALLGRPEAHAPGPGHAEPIQPRAEDERPLRQGQGPGGQGLDPGRADPTGASSGSARSNSAT